MIIDHEIRPRGVQFSLYLCEKLAVTDARMQESKFTNWEYDFRQNRTTQSAVITKSKL